uniref:Tyr recombinase domain-containing protein n=1 Tax=Globodera rostochiensis TaxID=31243 RepID=A0A914HSV4_GLORO
MVLLRQDVALLETVHSKCKQIAKTTASRAKYIIFHLLVDNGQRSELAYKLRRNEFLAVRHVGERNLKMTPLLDTKNDADDVWIGWSDKLYFLTNLLRDYIQKQSAVPAQALSNELDFVFRKPQGIHEPVCRKHMNEALRNFISRFKDVDCIPFTLHKIRNIVASQTANYGRDLQEDLEFDKYVHTVLH